MLNGCLKNYFPEVVMAILSAASVRLKWAAAGLLIEAAKRDGYTEVERDMATQAIMKLFHIDNASAVALRQEAEDLQAKATHDDGLCRCGPPLRP